MKVSNQPMRNINVDIKQAGMVNLLYRINQ